MAYDETFWATTATVTAAVFVATTVSLSQSLDALVERIHEASAGVDRPGTRRASRARRRGLVSAYAFAAVSMFLTMAALIVSLLSMADSTDLVPRAACVVVLILAVAAAVAQVFRAADAKLAQADGERRRRG